MATIEEMEQAFLASPDGVTLVALYEVLRDELLDSRLAEVLDKIRPIQHRVTLIQADATPLLLEALSRDPHKQVRQVVATHAHINDEVCFRLAEDQEASVRLALRKNGRCHPVIWAALSVRERQPNAPIAELLIEISWQARRAGLDRAALVTLIEEWTERDADGLSDLTVEQAHLVLEVLAARLGQGKMPTRPRKPRGKKTKARGASRKR